MTTDLIQCVSETLMSIDYKENPYFVALRSKTFEKEDFIETQIQFYDAVVFFSRPMAVLAAKIPTTDMRVNIIHNVFEEHGEGDPGRFHERTFLALLSRFSVTKEDIEKRTLWPEVRAFNTTLTGVCVMDSYLVGTAVLGIIERMFSEISAWIGKGIVDNGWLKREEVVHYSLHEDLDVKHSEEFFDILTKPWKESEANRYFIRQGLLMGCYIFNQLYEGLYRARKRRDLRNYRGSHTPN